MDDEEKFLTEFWLVNAEGMAEYENHQLVMDLGQSFSTYLKARC